MGLPDCSEEVFVFFEEMRSPQFVDAMYAMENAWRSCASARPPDYIIASDHFMLAYRRAMRPHRRQIGGSSLRAIKRRAMRRPW